DQAAQRDHLAVATAHVDSVDVVYRGPVIGFRLYLHLPRAAEQVHVVDIISAQRCLQRLEYGRWVNLQNLRLVSIDIEVDRRCRRREGAEHPAEPWILIRRDQQTA